jgi:Bacterial antitoxin of type II TA system, VapB
MKTTVDIDDRKLRRVMKLTGLKTRKETIDFALTEAERLARVSRMFQKPFYTEEEGPIIDPDYDLLGMRKRERPRHASH